MKRKDFLRNIVIALAATILPKILQPSTFDIEEEMEDVCVCVNWVLFEWNGAEVKSPEPTQFVIRMPKSQADNFIKSKVFFYK